MSIQGTRFRTRMLCEARIRSGVQRRLERRAVGGVVVAYHGVVEQACDPLLDLYNIDLDTFEAHVGFFCRHFDVVPLRRIVERIDHGEPIPRDWVAITMDDALRNQVTLAADALRAHGCPWTLAVPVGLIGTGRSLWSYELRFLILNCWPFASLPSPLDPTEAVPTASLHQKRAAAQRIPQLLMTGVDNRRREEYLDALIDQYGRAEFLERLAADGRFVLANWEQLLSLQSAGIELASHGWAHRPQNATIRPDALEEEIVASRDRMAEELGRAPQGFVLPHGLSGPHTREILGGAGYQYCLSTEPRRLRPDTHKMNIPRFDAEHPLAVLRRHLLGH